MFKPFQVANENEAHWIQLASGARFNLSGPVSPLRIEDVAWQLSKICRFAGACKLHFSVAQHSVIVSAILQRWGCSRVTCIRGLLHDAHEIAVGDQLRPVKQMMPGAVRGYWRVLENAIDHRICQGLEIAGESFDLAWDNDEATTKLIKRADEIALVTEQRDVMLPSHEAWQLNEDPLEHVIVGQDADAARTSFLLRWECLQPENWPRIAEENRT